MKYSRLTAQKRNKIFRCFAEDINATKTAALAGINRNTANLYFKEIRCLILRECLAKTAQEAGEFELDESYFGAKRIRSRVFSSAALATRITYTQPSRFKKPKMEIFSPLFCFS